MLYFEFKPVAISIVNFSEIIFREDDKTISKITRAKYQIYEELPNKAKQNIALFLPNHKK